MQNRETQLWKHAESAGFVRLFCFTLFSLTDEGKVPQTDVVTLSTEKGVS